ncbi:MAG: cache domain-containing protein [Deltaproteobacteria bacterium]|nr:cache domain-containing protein [Deltaproteobacteria bacterium]
MKSASAFFRNLPINVKLMVGYSSIFIITGLFASLVLYFSVRDTIETNIESELKNTTVSILNMVHAAAQNAIRNYMRAVAETNLILLQDLYEKQQRGVLSEEQARANAKQMMAGQKIGKSGYLYCANSQGVAVVHPNPGVAGRSFLDRDFIKEQIRRREGYLEYDWKNPGETEEHPKALYMVYFAPWDWIISVSVYRDEFKDLVNVSDFRQNILSLKFRQNGYSFVLDGSGNVIIHPKLKSGQPDGYDDEDTKIIRDIVRKKSGKLTYAWKNPDEKQRREKLVIFNHIPEFDWFVASSCYLEEVYAPLSSLRNIVFVTIAGTLLLAFPITLLISASITRPLRTLMDRFSAGAAGDMTVRMDMNTRDEIGHLAGYFNEFMDKLALSQSLEQEILDISQREQQKIGRDLHDDLGPHLMGVDVLTCVLEKKLRSKHAAETSDAAKIRELVGDAIHKLRRLARGLCPMDLGDQGLDASLGELAGYIEDVFGISCRLQCDDPVRLSDQTVATHIHYIAHEALHNAVKHAGAKNIRIFLFFRDSNMILKIEDDGCGLPASVRNDGMGLRIMKYRAHRINAVLSINGRPGRGTVVTLEIAGLQSQRG